MLMWQIWPWKSMNKSRKITISYLLKKPTNLSPSLSEHIKGATFPFMTSIRKCTSLKTEGFVQILMSKSRVTSLMKTNWKLTMNRAPYLKLVFKMNWSWKKKLFRSQKKCRHKINAKKSPKSIKKWDKIKMNLAAIKIHGLGTDKIYKTEHLLLNTKRNSKKPN